MSAQWYTPADIAVMFDVSRDTVWRWCEQHIIPAVKVGSVWRIHRASFDAYHEALSETARRDARCLETVERGPSTNANPGTSDGSRPSSLRIVPPDSSTDAPKPTPSRRGPKPSRKTAIGAWGSGGKSR